MNVEIRRVNSQDKEIWLQMRKGIWPDAPDADLSYDMDKLLANADGAAFIAFVDGQPAGMIEASLRKDYVEGCETSPVGYIEAWFVYPNFRGSGVAGVLTSAAENWAREKGCAEMGSDTWLENEASIRAHKKLGYAEIERLVHFVKPLG
ncbi:MAG: GNAT family N-acetyltransferase [Anaerolineales bacterium]|nr:GNAT family N-acetyltransferase [Anaerolineales bacterium]